MLFKRTYLISLAVLVLFVLVTVCIAKKIDRRIKIARTRSEFAWIGYKVNYVISTPNIITNSEYAPIVHEKLPQVKYYQGHFIDCWGTPYSISLETNIDVLRISLRSAGPDLRFGTQDDIESRQDYEIERHK